MIDLLPFREAGDLLLLEPAKGVEIVGPAFSSPAFFSPSDTCGSHQPRAEKLQRPYWK